MAKGLEEIADELYAAEPQGFVAGRDAAVAQGKATGDTALASAIAKLRKPTVGAWLVNQLSLKRPKAVRDLLELGVSMREAQRRLKGDQLRQLAAQRRAVIGSLVGQAQELAVLAQPGTSPAKLPLTEVEATLTAALADDEVAEQVRTGRLVKAVSYAGFGDLPMVGGETEERTEGRTRAGEEAPPKRPSREEQAAARAAERERRKELEAAQQAEAEAREALETAESAETDTVARLARIEEQIDDLERQRGETRAALQWARAAQKAAQRALTAATRRVAQAEAAME